MFDFNRLDQFQLGRNLTKQKSKDHLTIIFKQAVHTKTGKMYAIKIITLLDNQKNNDDMKQLFNQINVLQQLDHENIVKLYSIIEQQKHIYLVFQYIQKKLSRQKNSITEKEAIIIITQLCDALNYLHNKNIIHRDVNITNIMFNGVGIDIQIKLIDFQYAGRVGPQQSRYTQCGSLDSLAPETINRDEQTKAVDIWGIGVLLFILLSKQQPFFKKTDKDSQIQQNTKDRIINGQLLEPKNKLPVQAMDLIKKIFNLDPQKRPSLKQIKNHQFMKKYNAVLKSSKVLIEEEVTFDLNAFNHVNEQTPNFEQISKLENKEQQLNFIIQKEILQQKISQEQKCKRELRKKIELVQQKINFINQSSKPKQIQNIQKKISILEENIRLHQQQTNKQKLKLKSTETEIKKLQKQKKSLQDNRINYEKSILGLNKFKKYLKNIQADNKKVSDRIRQLQGEVQKNIINDDKIQDINIKNQAKNKLKTESSISSSSKIKPKNTSQSLNNFIQELTSKGTAKKY